MPKRKTLDEVRETIYQISSGSVEILSKEYQNDSAPLLVKCSCGNTFTRSYKKLKAGFICCPECSKKHQSEARRTNLQDVIQKINESGCEYVSGDYINNTSVLTIRCRCGNIFSKSFMKFSGGQNRCPECGRKILSDSKRRYDIDSARKVLSSHGFTLIDDCFYGAHKKHRCLCKNGHECNIVLSQMLVGRSGCPECAREAQKGTLHHNYNGGVSKVHELIRQALDDWKDAIRASYGNTCPVTGETGDKCVVHHLESLRTIFDSVSQKYGESVDLNGKLNEYSDYENFDKIRFEVISRHTMKTGILISNDLHLAFHKEYGKMNTTPEQFDEFLQKHYNTTLEKVVNFKGR